MNTAQKVKTIRMALGLSQPKLANLFKVDQSMISHIENGRSTLPMNLAKVLISICKKEGFLLGTKKKPQEVTLDYLFGDDDNE